MTEQQIRAAFVSSASPCISGSNAYHSAVTCGSACKHLYSHVLVALATTRPVAILQDLSLAGNQLTTLPANIGNLRYLKRLQLAGNVLESLPDSVCNLTALEVCGIPAVKSQ